MALRGIKGKCLRPGCTRGAVVRGLCNPDIQAVYLAIKRGDVTMAQLEKEGKVQKSVRTGIQKWIKKGGGNGQGTEVSATEE